MLRISTRPVIFVGVGVFSVLNRVGFWSWIGLIRSLARHWRVWASDEGNALCIDRELSNYLVMTVILYPSVLCPCVLGSFGSLGSCCNPNDPSDRLDHCSRTMIQAILLWLVKAHLFLVCQHPGLSPYLCHLPRFFAYRY
jgi:hypothetical protein